MYTKEELIAFETYVKNLFELGHIHAPVHLSGGNEDELIKIFKDIKKDDYVFSTHRNHYHFLLKGGEAFDLLEELQGRTTAICGGKAKSMHVCDKRINFYSSAIVGGCCAIAVGVGIALKRKNKGVNKKHQQHVWCFVGDGATDGGHFWEAIRYVYSNKLPVTFVIEDNDRSVETTKRDRWGLYDSNRFLSDEFVRYYKYKATYPHVGVGHHVSM